LGQWVIWKIFFKDASKECIKMKNSLFEINIPIFHHSNGNLARSCLAMAGGANRTNLLLWAHAIFVKKTRERFQA